MVGAHHNTVIKGGTAVLRAGRYLGRNLRALTGPLVKQQTELNLNYPSTPHTILQYIETIYNGKCEAKYRSWVQPAWVPRGSYLEDTYNTHAHVKL